MPLHFEDATYPEEPKMRMIPFVFVAFVTSSPALAQSWEEYAYPDYAFSVAFPANPQVETTTYHVADNRSVPARLYSVRQGNVVFKMTVAELEGTNLEESAVIDHAIRTLSQGATVRVNIPARIYQVYGRQLTAEGADGSRSMVQLFDYSDSTRSRLRRFLARMSASPSPTWSAFINR
jgi:hypothetical protein